MDSCTFLCSSMPCDSCGNNAKCRVEGIGTISFISMNGEVKKLSNGLYVSHIKRNLLLVAYTIDLDHEVRFIKTRAKILDGARKVFGKGEGKNNLCELNALIATTFADMSELWHERFGHIPFVVLKEMCKESMLVNLVDN